MVSEVAADMSLTACATAMIGISIDWTTEPDPSGADVVFRNGRFRQGHHER
jgi:hypothetical protein